MKKYYFRALRWAAFFTITGISQTFAQQTYYSYQSGNWNNPATWTTDPSGTTTENNPTAVPGNNDAVVILGSRTVALTASVATTGHQLTVELGGELDFRTFTIMPLISLSGSGRIRINHAYFPAVATSNFATPTGGTVEYYDFTGSLPAQFTYRNLTLTNTSAVNDFVMTLPNPSNPTNYALNGNLRLRSTNGKKLTVVLGSAGTNPIHLKIGDATADIPGSLRMGSETNADQVELRAANLNTIHRITINGNLENHGLLQLSNSLPHQTANNGAADVTFTGQSNALVSGTGAKFYFYKLIVNKGTDQTYVLDVNPANKLDAANEPVFKLFASTQPANLIGTDADGTFDALNPKSNKALWIRNGTLKLGANIFIPKLADDDGVAAGSGDDFTIPLNGALWIDGAAVASTDNDGNANKTSISVIGTFRMSNGFWYGNKSAGIIYRYTGKVIVEGGTVNVAQYRRSTQVDGTISYAYIQTGGEFTVRGGGITDNRFALFNIPDAASTFQMTGGVLNIRDVSPNTTATSPLPDYEGNGIFIAADPANSQVTGGTVNVYLPNGKTGEILTSVPFYNLNLVNTIPTGMATVSLLKNDVTLLNTLTVGTGVTLSAQDAVYSVNPNVTVGGNFTVSAGAAYVPGTNTTTFDGSTNQTVTINQATPEFFNLSVKSQGIAAFTGNSPRVRGTLFMHEGSTLTDGGLTFTVDGGAGTGIFNAGTHTGNGALLLQGAAFQNISGNNGVFANLSINNPNGVALSGNHSVNGNLRLAAGIVDIQDNTLTLNQTANLYSSLTTNETVFNNTRMIRTAGSRSDGGLQVAYRVPQPGNFSPFTFPVGVQEVATNNNKYTPVTIRVRTTGNYGKITVRPVNREHPTVTQIGQSLSYYWRVTSTGWTGEIIAEHHTYTYLPGDVKGTAAQTQQYRAARYDQLAATWKYGAANETFDATSQVTIRPFNTSTFISFNNPNPFISTIDGEFTAGNEAAFGGVQIYYSYRNGNWADVNTWSTTGHTGVQTVPAVKPGLNAVVKISTGHTVAVTTAGGEQSGSLMVAEGAVLDLTTTTGNDFGTLIGEEAVGGTGTLRISAAAATAQFPAGDFGAFIGVTGGTVEYYTTGATNFTIPVTYTDNGAARLLNTYRYLLLNPGAGQLITTPNFDPGLYPALPSVSSALTVSGNLTIGSLTGFTGSVLVSDGNYADLLINGSLTITRGTLQLPGTGATNRSIVVDKDVQLSTEGKFAVQNAGNRFHTFAIRGNLTNNGAFDTYPSATNVATSACTVIFSGETDATISGTGSSTDFYHLIVNKGATQTRVLNVTATNFSFRSGTALPADALPLTLANGTFRLTSPVTVQLSANTANNYRFAIPPTACLSANGGTLQIGTGNNNASDLLLNGKLEVRAGMVQVGNGGNYNHDIEYGTSGTSEIDVQGGMLVVNGQIRKDIDNPIGTLTYQQSGTSQVSIQGRNYNSNAKQQARAKIEIDGSGSTFTMTGGTLTIVRGGGTVTGGAGDLYLRPANAAVTGGEIVLAPGAAIGSQAYTVDAAIPLHNLIITGFNATSQATASLNVNALYVNNLTIHASSVFNTKDVGVTMEGDFTNAGTYLAGVNTTTFTGNNAQTATLNEATTFYNLVVTKTPASGNQTSVTFAGTQNPTVTNRLSLQNGILNDGGKTILVTGDVTNQAVHAGTGKITMNSNSPFSRTISGNGSFATLNIDDVNNVLLQGNITVITQLQLTNGLFDIADRLLKLGANATVANAGNARYIRTNGVLSDSGVQKSFAAGTGNYAFTFPIGSPAGYTPAQLNGTATVATGGFITVKPVNDKHPATRAALNTELLYFWNVASSGFTSVSAARHQYTYLNAGVQGTEAEYVPGRFDPRSGSWLYGATNDLNNPEHTIGNPTFTTNGFWQDPGPVTVNTVYVDGDYTAGYADEFTQVKTFYSVKSGQWGDAATWSVSETENSNPLNETPDGNPVVIRTGHAVESVAANRYAASVELQGNATLNLGKNAGHNLGTVKGTGTIRIEATDAGSLVFPAGDYSQFVAVTGGTIEYFSNSEAMLPKNTTYNHIHFTGSGTKRMAQADLTIRGNWNNQSAAATGATVFSDDNLETVTLAGVDQLLISTTPILFNQLVVENGGVKTFDATIMVDGTEDYAGELTLKNGILEGTGNSSVTVKRAGITGGSLQSYVGSPLTIEQPGSKFFPIGRGGVYRPVILTDPTGNLPVIRAQLVNESPVQQGGKPDNVAYGGDENPEKLDRISDIRYWEISLVGTVTPLIRVTGTFAYDPADDVAPVANQLRISQSPQVNGLYKSASAGRGADATSPFAGLSSITSDILTSLDFFALASITPVNALPVRLVYVKARQEGALVVVSWATSSETNTSHFVVERSLDGVQFESLGNVPAQGNSQSVHTYAFTDRNLPGDAIVLYYRLKQVDDDGKTEDSEVVPVSIQRIVENATANWRVYPNPLHGEELQIEALNGQLTPTNTYTFRLYSLTGRVLLTQPATLFTALTNLRNTLALAPRGLYLLQIESERGRDTFKLVKQ